jgi:PAS domain S-box-containing protein
MAGQHEFERLTAALDGDSGFAPFAGPDAAILAWDASVERIVWASPAATALRDVLTRDDGLIDPSFAARARLAALADGLAPRQGMRLERLRLDPTRLATPVTCACRLVALPSGEAVLVTAIVGRVPKMAARPRRASMVEETAGEPLETATTPAPAWKPRPSGTVRFVWKADAETRFIQVSAALAEVVGPAAGGIVGRTWADLASSVVEDLGDISALLARRATFSGRAMYWTVDGTDLQVPGTFAGMPIFGPDRRLVGFRGFGLLRPQATRRRTAAGAERDNGDATGPDPAFLPEQEKSGPTVLHDAGAAEPSFAADQPGPAATFFEDLSAEDPHDLDETAPTEPSSEAPTEGEDSWFAGLRERVSATLSGAKAAILPGEPVTEPAAPIRPPRTLEPQHGLSSAERTAFREIARALGARFDDEPSPEPPSARHPEPQNPESQNRESENREPQSPEHPPWASRLADADKVLDRLPVGVIVHREERILFANRLLLDLVDYDDVGQIGPEGGLARLFRGSPTLLGPNEGGAPLALSTRGNQSIPVEVRLATVEWAGLPATLMMVGTVPEPDAREGLRTAEAEVSRREARVKELESILDTATDGVIVVDETGRILSLNRSAEALFGYDQREVVGDALTVLFAPESHIVALDYLDGLRSSGVASLLNDGREVMGRVRQGGAIPLFMTMGHVNEGPDRKFCAVLRDITAFKKAEGELVAAKRAAEEASAQKSDLLAKISHEIRTPLNAIIGFAEVMLEERFGPVGNDRYKDYLKDVHASGAHVMSLVNDLLDLAKIEAGRMELSFMSVSLNELVGATVALLQPHAARERIVMRTSFAPRLPPVVADERSIRQIVLNLVSNAIKFTDAGGQVIVSTALTDRGEMAFRVRDTGIGMTEEEIEVALEPFRQLATARKRGGTGLGLPLTKALVEANRGALRLSSNPNEGTLVEVLFPPARVLAE